MGCVITALTEHFGKKISRINFEESCSKLDATFIDGRKIIANIPDFSFTNDNNSDNPSAGTLYI